MAKMVSLNEGDKSEVLYALQEQGDFMIQPCENGINLRDKSLYREVKVNDGQRAQIAALLQQMPDAAAAVGLNQAYFCVFPEGMPHALMKLKQGGFGSPIMGEQGIIGSASFYPAKLMGAAMGAFTAVSAVTGQYFLSEINQKMDAINKGLDSVMNFLEDEKESELLAEVSFLNYAYSNFSSIMAHEEQRAGSITGIQNARKIALKDIMFYTKELNTLTKDARDDDVMKIYDKAIERKSDLETAVQLFVMSHILEVYYAQNTDASYIEAVKKESHKILNQYKNGITSNFSVVRNLLEGARSRRLQRRETVKACDDRLEIVKKIMAPYKDGEDDPLEANVAKALSDFTKTEKYYLASDGKVYIEATVA